MRSKRKNKNDSRKREIKLRIRRNWAGSARLLVLLYLFVPQYNRGRGGALSLRELSRGGTWHARSRESCTECNINLYERVRGPAAGSLLGGGRGRRGSAA